MISPGMNVCAGAVGGFPRPPSGEKNVLTSSFASRGSVISGRTGFARGAGFRAHPCKSMAAPGCGLPTVEYPGNPGRPAAQTITAGPQPADTRTKRFPCRCSPKSCPPPPLPSWPAPWPWPPPMRELLRFPRRVPMTGPANRAPSIRIRSSWCLEPLRAWTRTGPPSRHTSRAPGTASSPSTTARPTACMPPRRSPIRRSSSPRSWIRCVPPPAPSRWISWATARAA